MASSRDKPRPITLNEYLGIVEKESEESKEHSRIACLDDQRRWWDLFYKRNENRFFKDRHWTTEEFPELSNAHEPLSFFEAGCGVGNFIIPLLKYNKNLRAFGCDISHNAVDIIRVR